MISIINKKDLNKKALRRRQDLKVELEQKKLLKKDRKKDIKKAIANCKKEQENGFMVPKSLQNTSWRDATELKLPSYAYIQILAQNITKIYFYL